MRSEKEMFDLILGFAENDVRVRAVYIMGSRTNPNVTKDQYQDYDICYVVTETRSFIADRQWLRIFGEPAIIQEPDMVDVAFGQAHDFERSYAWLMLFKDGVRIDLGLIVTEDALEDYLSDRLNVKLLDKDNILSDNPQPSDVIFWVQKPDEAQYAGCCNEFWWCLNNVGKGIARDELPYAMWMYHVVVREMLVKMMEWHIGIHTDFSVSAGKAGKFFKKYLPADLYDQYVKTYSSGAYNDFWAAVMTACALFRTVALEVGAHFGFVYNQSEDANMMDYLNNIRL